MGWLPRWGTFLQGSCVLRQLRSSPAPGPRMVQPFPNPFLLPPLLPSPSNPCPMPTSCAWRVSCTILSKRNLIHSFTHQKWTRSPWDTNIYAPRPGTSSCSSWSRYMSRAVLTNRSFCNFMPPLFSSVDTSHTWLLNPRKWFFPKHLKVKYSFKKYYPVMSNPLKKFWLALRELVAIQRITIFIILYLKLWILLKRIFIKLFPYNSPNVMSIF